MAARIEEAHAENFHHEAVAAPKHANPFPDDESITLFYNALEAAIHQGIVPSGYGLRPEEWGEEGYPSVEILKSGRRGGRQLRIPLPDGIWQPRAEQWGSTNTDATRNVSLEFPWPGTPYKISLINIESLIECKTKQTLLFDFLPAGLMPLFASELAAALERDTGLAFELDGSDPRALLILSSVVAAEAELLELLSIPARIP